MKVITTKKNKKYTCTKCPWYPCDDSFGAHLFDEECWKRRAFRILRDEVKTMRKATRHVVNNAIPGTKYSIPYDVYVISGLDMEVLKWRS
jgi:hypothetical protein